MSEGSTESTAEALARRLRATELVADVSRRFIVLRSADVEKGINGALESVVKAFGFNRGLVTVFSEDKRSFTLTHRYARVPIETVFDVGEPIPVDVSPWLIPKQLAGEEVVFSGELKLPEEAAVEREWATRTGTRSVAMFPLVVGGDVIGFVAFYGSEAWDIENLDQVRIVAQIFASALDRKRTDDELRRRLTLMELISEVSTRLIDVPASRLDEAIDEGLVRIGELSGIRRCLIYEVSDDRSTFSITHRYLSAGIEPRMAIGTPLPASRYPFLFSRFSEKGPVEMSAALVPDHAESERIELGLDALRHIVGYPFLLDGVVLGSVCFETHERPEKSYIEALHIIGELFTSTLARQRAERAAAERLRFEETLARVSARLVSDTQDVEKAITEALGAVAQTLDFDRAAIFRLTQDKRRFELQFEWASEGVARFAGTRMADVDIDEAGWPLTEIREGRAMVFGPEDLESERSAGRRILARDGTRLLATIPLVVGGEVLGVIGLHRIRSTRSLTERQHQRLRLLGEMFADALARRTAEASLRQAEARFAQVIASAIDGFTMVTEAGIVLEWTPQAERILGRPRGQALGTELSELFTWDEPRRARDRVVVAEIVSRAKHGRVELLARHADGRDVPVELSISSLESTGGPRYAVFIRDIADRRRSEQVKQAAFEEIALLKSKVEGERDYLRQELITERRLEGFVGRSVALGRVIELVESVAGTSATVLIRGASGVGKELVARAIHERSGRSQGPLVKVNCASIPKELFESEFFGHVRGAFTGAHKDRVGRFELADHGTLFLDEVGEIPVALQAKLLRVLQESEFERVGDDRTRRVDVRVVAATNRDLEVEATAGRFRKDLFYRLSVFPIEVPPLRDRPDDVVPLAEHFLELHGRSMGRPGHTLTPSQRRRLEAYDWPGNVRELQHVIERALILSPGTSLRLDVALPDAPISPASPSAQGKLLTEAELRALERDNLLAALEGSGWRISGPNGAAERLGINASTLRDRMRSFDVKKPAAD